MQKLLRRLHPLGRKLNSILSQGLRGKRHHSGRHTSAAERNVPAYVHHVYDGWEVCTGDGIRCHCFTPWYDACKLLPGGHAELTKRRSEGNVVYRFRWCKTANAYAPDPRGESPGPAPV